MGEQGDTGEAFAMAPDVIRDRVPLIRRHGAGVGDVVVQPGGAGALGLAGEHPVLLDELDEMQEVHRADLVAQDGMRRRLDREREDVVGVRPVDRGLGHVRVGGVKMPVDGVAAAGLHPAEIVPRMVRVDAGGRAEQQ